MIVKIDKIVADDGQSLKSDGGEFPGDGLCCCGPPPPPTLCIPRRYRLVWGRKQRQPSPAGNRGKCAEKEDGLLGAMHVSRTCSPQPSHRRPLFAFPFSLVVVHEASDFLGRTLLKSPRCGALEAGRVAEEAACSGLAQVVPRCAQVDVPRP